MELVLQRQIVQMRRNFKTNHEHRMRDEMCEDFPPVVKLFNPCGAATWLLTELDEDHSTAFGLADLGDPNCIELGYVSLNELREIELPFGLSIERDIHFEPTKTLKQYYEEARFEGRIVA